MQASSSSSNTTRFKSTRLSCAALLAGLLGCAAPESPAPPLPPRLQRDIPLAPTRPPQADASLSTARVPGASPVGDFAALHAAHTDLLARAHGQALSTLALAQRPNALEHQGNLYALSEVFLVLGSDTPKVLPDFDPHVTTGLPSHTPDAAMAEFLLAQGAVLRKQGNRLIGVAPLDLTAPACATCHRDRQDRPARLLYTLHEVADD